MINGMEIRVHGKASHWCEAHKGIDSIYAASLVVKAPVSYTHLDVYKRQG